MLLEAAQQRPTFGHDAMHCNRQEEDGVTVVGSRSSAEVFLHGLNDGKQLFCQLIHIMDYYLAETPETALSRHFWGQAQLQQPLLSLHQHRVRGKVGKAQTVLVALQLHKGAWLPQALNILLMQELVKCRGRRRAFTATL